MVVMVGIGPRRSGLSDTEFAGLWAGRHAGIVRNLPFLERYVQHHALPGRPHPSFDCFAELHFTDLDRLKEAFRSEWYRDRVARDEESLVQRDRMQGLRAELDSDAAGDPAAALVYLYGVEPPARQMPRTRRLVALPGDRSGIRAVDIVAFDSAEEAIRVLGQVAPAPGVTHFCSRPLRVV